MPDCFAFYLLSRYGMNYHEGTCLIDLMMHTGKINYVVQNLLGYSDIGEAMGYSKEESDWCKDNEKEIWNYICTNDHLHARDPMVIRYYMTVSYTHLSSPSPWNVGFVIRVNS